MDSGGVLVRHGVGGMEACRRCSNMEAWKYRGGLQVCRRGCTEGWNSGGLEVCCRFALGLDILEVWRRASVATWRHGVRSQPCASVGICI